MRWLPKTPEIRPSAGQIQPDRKPGSARSSLRAAAVLRRSSFSFAIRSGSGGGVTLAGGSPSIRCTL
jgi:hypothetical protein